MLIKALIEGVISVASFLMSTVIGSMPASDVNQALLDIVTGIISITGQANNFAHFVAGSSIDIILPLLVPFLTFKYIVYPVLTFVRSIFVNGNN